MLSTHREGIARSLGSSGSLAGEVARGERKSRGGADVVCCRSRENKENERERSGLAQWSRWSCLLCRRCLGEGDDTLRRFPR